jgi:hypothetical protein
VGTPNNLRRVKISQAQMTLLSDSWVPGIAGRSGPRPPFVNSVNALSLQVLASPDAAERFVQRIRRLGFAAVVVIKTTDAEEYCSALAPVLGQPEQIAGRYFYFPLYGDPRQAPLPSSLDIGEQLAEAIQQQAYSVQVGRLDQTSFHVTVCPTDSLMGVVQRKQRIIVPYEFTSPAGDAIHGTGIVTLDQVTDQPDLSFIVHEPHQSRR